MYLRRTRRAQSSRTLRPRKLWRIAILWTCAAPAVREAGDMPRVLRAARDRATDGLGEPARGRSCGRHGEAPGRSRLAGMLSAMSRGPGGFQRGAWGGALLAP